MAFYLAKCEKAVIVVRAESEREASEFAGNVLIQLEIDEEFEIEWLGPDEMYGAIHTEEKE